jgi:hypothetical protein
VWLPFTNANGNDIFVHIFDCGWPDVLPHYDSPDSWFDAKEFFENFNISPRGDEVTGTENM